MRAAAWLACVASTLSCGDPSLPKLPGDDAGGRDANGDSQQSDAPADAAAALLTATASPSSFVLHANDTRLTKLTVTNTGGQTSGVPALQVTGLILGTMSFTSNMCTSGLAPGASCTAAGNLAATTAGQVNFQVTADATPGGTSIAAMSLMVMPACAATCGPSGTSNCCASAVVPGNAPGATLAGASFYRSYNGVGYNYMGFPATVSHFRLDTYEVTVVRFRAFVDAGMGTQSTPPAAGAGGRTLNGMANQGGWDAAWNASLSGNTTSLMANVKCNATYQTWTDTTGANESLPMNCLSWYDAMAFCIWDGGHLPTEAERNYAAAGGSEHRAYPWSSPASALSIDCSYTNYNINNPAGTFCVNGTTGAVNRVGSESPKGDGRWGQSDLSGNVSEWTLDWYASPYPMTTCNDCANFTAALDRGSVALASAMRRRPSSGPSAAASIRRCASLSSGRVVAGLRERGRMRVAVGQRLHDPLRLPH